MSNKLISNGFYIEKEIPKSRLREIIKSVDVLPKVSPNKVVIGLLGPYDWEVFSLSKSTLKKMLSFDKVYIISWTTKQVEVFNSLSSYAKKEQYLMSYISQTAEYQVLVKDLVELKKINPDRFNSIYKVKKKEWLKESMQTWAMYEYSFMKYFYENVNQESLETDKDIIEKYREEYELFLEKNSDIEPEDNLFLKEYMAADKKIGVVVGLSRRKDKIYAKLVLKEELESGGEPKFVANVSNKFKTKKDSQQPSYISDAISDLDEEEFVDKQPDLANESYANLDKLGSISDTQKEILKDIYGYKIMYAGTMHRIAKYLPRDTKPVELVSEEGDIIYVDVAEVLL